MAVRDRSDGMGWLAFALLSAVAAALTTVLSKLGVEGVSSTQAMAIRTAVVFACAWGLLFATSAQPLLPAMSSRTWAFLVASGVATGVSWWAYLVALQQAPATWVAPIDKLSLPITIALAVGFLGESITWRAALGVVLIVIGTLLTRT
jgi:transporter family protein